mgnify:FL=1
MSNWNRPCPKCNEPLERQHHNGVIYRILKIWKGRKIGFYLCLNCSWKGILNRKTSQPVVVMNNGKIQKR